MTEFENTRTLRELVDGVSKEQKEIAIDKFTDLLSSIAKSLYRQYQVLRQDPQSDDQRFFGHQLLFQSHVTDRLTRNEYQQMYKLAFDNNLNVYEINPVFREKVRKGKVLELGDVVITDTALGNILDGQTFSFSISFMPIETYKEMKEKEKEAEEKINKKLGKTNE